jgi:outer membrane protein assembly factor BamB
MYRSSPSPSPFVFTAADGSVTAYARSTGEVAWSFRVPNDALGFRHVTRLVADDHHVVIAAARMNESGFFASADGTLHLCCLEYGTGRVRWQHQVKGGHNIAHFTATLLIDAGQVFLVHGAGLLAFALETGQLMWKQRVEGALNNANVPVPVAIAVSGFAQQGDAK